MSKTCGLKLSKIQASEIEQSLTTLKIKGNLKFTKRALTHEFQNSKQSLYLTHRPYSSIFYVWPRYVFLQLTSNGTHKKIRNMENKGGNAGKEENVSGHPQQNMSKTCGVELFKEMGLQRCPKKALCTAKQSTINRGGDSPMKIQGSCHPSTAVLFAVAGHRIMVMSGNPGKYLPESNMHILYVLGLVSAYILCNIFPSLEN